MTNPVLDPTSPIESSAETLLALNAQKFQAIFNNSGDAIFILDTNGRFLEVNQECCTRYGYSRDDFMHMGVQQIDSADEGVDVDMKLAQLKQAGHSVFDTVHLSTNGRKIPTEVNSRLITIGDQCVIINTCRDISERIRAARELAVSQNRYRQFASLVSDYFHSCIRTAGLPYRIEWIGGATEAITGYSKNELLTMGCWCPLVHKDDALRVHDHLAGLVAGDRAEIEFRLVSKTGAVRWIRNTCRCEAGNKPGELRLFGASQDVTPYKQATVREHRQQRWQEALLRLYGLSDESCETILDFGLEEALRLTESPIGYIFHYDEDTRLLSLHSWSSSAMPQCLIQEKQTTYELDKTGLWGEAIRKRQAIITNDYSAPNEFKKGCPERHVALVRHMNIPIFRNKRIVAVIGVGNKADEYSDEDVKQLRLFMDGLWNVLERGRAEGQLASAKEAAEAANRAKSEFLAIMSHEIRTPMNSIVSLARLMSSSPHNDEQREYLDGIKTSADNLLHIINDILDFSRIESGHIELDHTTFSPRALVHEALKPLLISLCSKGLEHTVDIGGDIPDSLSGDPHRLRQVITNLLTNAIKFTEKGAIHISVNLEACETKRALLHFSVTDNGIGIPPEVLDRIFAPFIQADSSTTRKFGGTGLGLTISRQLVELMGGAIWVESEPGQGSTFHFTALCDVVAQKPVKRARSAAADQKNLFKWEGRSLHILLAEDHDINRSLTMTILQKLGHTVTAVENGRLALDASIQERFDVILMDVEMPEMDGWQATKRIREQEAANGAHTPIIALTAHALKGNRETLLESGFSGYVSKPINFDVLCKEIKRVVA